MKKQTPNKTAEALKNELLKKYNIIIKALEQNARVAFKYDQDRQAVRVYIEEIKRI